MSHRRVLVRAPREPWERVGARRSIRLMGGNEGNLLYINGVCRALSAPRHRLSVGGYLVHRDEDPSSWIEETNRTQDVFVLPMANAFRLGYAPRLAKLATIIRRLDIPTVLVGVGAQATLDSAHTDGDIRMGSTGRQRTLASDESRQHDETVRDFVEAVLEKSSSIGVRGHFTRRYLAGIGVDESRVRVIGCPSMYTWGENLPIRPKLASGLAADTPIGMSVDYRIDAMAAIVALNTELYPRLESPVQDSRSAHLVLTGDSEFDLSRIDARMPVHTDHPLYRERRLVYYPNPWGWIESYRERAFTFGTRLHGTIAGILGGAHGHLLVHDTRTLELAELHRIPHSHIDSYASPPTAAELYDATDMTPMLEAHPALFANYVEFLHENGLATSFDSRLALRAFDRRVRRNLSPGGRRPKSVTL